MVKKFFFKIDASDKTKVSNYFLTAEGTENCKVKEYDLGTKNNEGQICFETEIVTSKSSDTVSKSETETVTFKFSDKVFMNRKSFSLLRKDVFLNDEVINFYGLLLKQCDKIDQYHYFSSQFYSSLRFNGKFDVEKTRKFFSGSLFSKRKFFIPIHIVPIHWALVVVNLITRSISYFDSMYSPSIGKTVNSDILQWLIFAASEYNIFLNANDWNMYEGAPGIPQQNNGFDCGVFVIMFMDFLSRNKSVSWIDCTETTEYRFAIGYAILQGNLKYIHTGEKM